MSTRRILRRRDFLRASLLATGTVALAACTTAPAPTPTKAPAAAPTTAPAAAPTKAPAAAPTSAPATAAPTKAAAAAPTTAPAAAPTKAPAAAATPAEKIGKQLIGKLEGPELIADPAKWPKTFKEAPALADLVKAGKLPPVQERIGQDPLVIKPVHEVGKYGGIWRRGFTGPADKMNGYRSASGPDYTLYVDLTGQKVTPNLAKGWEVSDGGRIITIFLRREMKWSDGKPFTADDFLFWFEDMYQNKDLVPNPTPLLSINFKPGTMEKVDKYTVRYKFPDPYYKFVEMLSLGSNLTSHSHNGLAGMGGFAPAHYLKQFHPKYTSQQELDKNAKDAKFDNWKSQFLFKNDWALNPELPTVTPWKTVIPINTPNWTLERNPYSVYVDTEGNQLPYLDKISMTLAENLEVLNLRAVAGEYDEQSRHIDSAKIPVYLENQQKGGYKLSLHPAIWGSDYGIFCNMDYRLDPEIGKLLGNTDFRRALSLGMERDQMNETFFLGTGVPGSGAPSDTSKYNPGPEYRALWSTYDPKKANEMLDKLGLEKKDTEGYRLRTDGKGRLRLEIASLGAMFLPYTQISEMVREQWKKIGIQADVAEMERSLLGRRGQANELQLLAIWNADTEPLYIGPPYLFPINATDWGSPEYGKWLATGGKTGNEPPTRMREAMALWRKGFGVPDEESIKLAQEVWKIGSDEVWYIGGVGQSGSIEGLRVHKTNLGNVSERFTNTNMSRPPSIYRPVTFYWKK